MSVHKFLVPSQPSWRSLVTGRMVRVCDCGYLTTTALALKYLFLILPSGCLSFSRVMASKLVPRLSLLSFFLHCEFLFRPHISKNYQRLGCFLLSSLIFSCTPYPQTLRSTTHPHIFLTCQHTHLPHT